MLPPLGRWNTIDSSSEDESSDESEISEDELDEAHAPLQTVLRRFED